MSLQSWEFRTLFLPRPGPAWPGYPASETCDLGAVGNARRAVDAAATGRARLAFADELEAWTKLAALAEAAAESAGAAGAESTSSFEDDERDPCAVAAASLAAVGRRAARAVAASVAASEAAGALVVVDAAAPLETPAALAPVLDGGADPASLSVAAVLRALRLDEDAHAAAAAHAAAKGAVRTVRGALGAAACAALRRAVDERRERRRDTVDGGADNQRNLALAELEALAGAAATQRLVAAAGGGAWDAVDVFVRRYARDDGRRGLGFHADGATRTCNVALSDDDPGGGGRLVVVAGGAVAALPRRAGDATLHDSTLLHAVTAVRPGAVRYSLILFFFRRAPR
jgi:hypothetical protein